MKPDAARAVFAAVLLDAWEEVMEACATGVWRSRNRDTVATVAWFLDARHADAPRDVLWRGTVGATLQCFDGGAHEYPFHRLVYGIPGGGCRKEYIDDSHRVLQDLAAAGVVLEPGESRRVWLDTVEYGPWPVNLFLERCGVDPGAFRDRLRRVVPRAIINEAERMLGERRVA